jgi:hypothetical protein
MRAFITFGSPPVHSEDQEDTEGEDLRGVKCWEPLALGVVGSYDSRSLANLITISDF